MPLKLSLEEVLDCRDLELGASRWVEVGQDRIQGFADATDDQQWIHVDVGRASEGPFGGTIAHGYLVMSLLPTLFCQLVEFSDVGMMVNFGIEKLRFLRPVMAGNRVRLVARIVSASRRRGGALMRVRGEIEDQTSGKRALATDVLFLLLPEAAEEPRG